MAPAPNNGENRGPFSGEENEIMDVPHPQFILNGVVTDSDDSGDEETENDVFSAYSGYQMLPQDNEEGDLVINEGQGEHYEAQAAEVFESNMLDFEHAGVSHSESEDSGVLNHASLQGSLTADESNMPKYLQLLPPPKSDPKDLLWNQKQASDRLQIDQGHAEKVKSAMSNIQLPTKNIPDWAKNISDEQWKEKLSQIKSFSKHNS